MSRSRLNAAAKSRLEQIERAVTNYAELGDGQSFAKFRAARFYDPKASQWTIPRERQPMTLLSAQQLGLIETLLLRVDAAGVRGDLVEAGIWRGGAVAFMRALLEAYAMAERSVIAADSFAGIPQSEYFRHDQVNKWSDRWEAGLDEVKAGLTRLGVLDDRMELLPGLFADTLPSLNDRELALIRLDSDSFDSTTTALECLYPLLNRHGAVIIDDWHLIGCRIAVDTYRRKNKLAGEVQVTADNAWWIKQEERG